MGWGQDGSSRGPGIPPAPGPRRPSWRRCLAAAAFPLLLAVLASPPATADTSDGEEPADAATLVRQALAALDAAPPNLDVASDKLQDALSASDTRGVDMARVREAAQALSLHDPSTTAHLLIAALGASSRDDARLLVPLRPRFRGTRGEEMLLVAGTLLVALGVLIVLRA
jgi:hypothetical protein